MALPLVPLLGAALRTAGSTAASVFARGTMGAAMRGADKDRPGVLARMAAIGRPDRPEPERYDQARLARRLGVAQPSPQQEAAERSRISQANKKNMPSVGKELKNAATNAAMFGLKTGGMVAALGLATKGATRLGAALNSAAMNDLRVFNTQIATVAARRDIFDLQQSARRGKLVSGSTKRLGEAMMEFDKRSQPFNALGENLTNEFARLVTELGNLMLNVSDSIGLTWVIEKANKYFGEEVSGDGRGAFLEYLKQQTTREAHKRCEANRRPNERPGGRM